MALFVSGTLLWKYSKCPLPGHCQRNNGCLQEAVQKYQFVAFGWNVANYVLCRILVEMSRFTRFPRHKMSAARHLKLFCTPAEGPTSGRPLGFWEIPTTLHRTGKYQHFFIFLTFCQFANLAFSKKIIANSMEKKTQKNWLNTVIREILKVVEKW